jgi:hypothetical protein
MSLLSLKCNTPSVKRKPVSVDTFIDEVELYANGKSTVVDLQEAAASLRDRKENCEDNTRFTRCTFTLSEGAKESLTQLSESTGIARSRLIRIWLSQLESGEIIEDFISSSVR